MLFDEPFASLDHNLRTQLRADVLAALRETGTAAVVVTHDQREALAIGDRIAVMRDGKLAQFGSPAEVFHQPADRFIAAFMGPASFVPITTSNSDASTVLGPIGAEVDGAYDWAMVRLDDVEFTASEGGSAVVVATEYSGVAWIGTARASDGSLVSFLRSHVDPVTIGQRGDLRLVAGHRQVLVKGD